MQQSDHATEREVRFHLRTSYKNVRIFYISFIVFLLLGIASLFFVEGDKIYASFMVIGFAAFMLLITWSQNLTYHSYYSIYPDHLLLKRGSQRRTIKMKNIEEIKILDEGEAMKQLVKFQEEELKTRNSLDMVAAFSAQRELGKFTSYCTVPVIFEKTTMGNHTNVVNQGAKTTGYFVLVSSKKGAKLLLSPLDCEGFVKQVDSYRNKNYEKV
ncbi:MAG: hypothetical protein K2X86_09715 [Cytophagaceae bacterium]|nr:hypothetical protein [Cytophagaceae bacterium]